MWKIFGKVPSEGDFVRHGLGDSLSMACFEWIASAVSQRSEWVTRIPRSGLRFSFTDPRSERRAIGVMVPSRDRVARSFPLVALTDTDTMKSSWPFAPIAWHRCLSEQDASLRASIAEGEPFAATVRRALDIALPTPTDLDQVERAAGRQLSELDLEDFHARVFADSDAHHYAYHTLRTAAGLAERARPTLVCPVHVLSDSIAWLDALRSIQHELARPPASLLWSTGSGSCLVICLYEASPLALHTAVGLPTQAASIWPLVTNHRGAREKAREEIEPLLPKSHARARDAWHALGRR